jgi:hypothetical protein
MPNISRPQLGRNTDEPRRTAQELREEIGRQASALVDLAVERGRAETTFGAFEGELVERTFAFARVVITLFLATAEERVTAQIPERVVRQGRAFRRDRRLPRSLMTRFGIVRYWRLYMRSCEAGASRRHGYHPLDVALGLMADRITPSLLALAVRLASRMSFAEARDVLGWFIPLVPSVEVIQAATIGYGRFAPEWFEIAPAPNDDGEVLLILLDSKGAPTATETELAKRRGKRKKGRKVRSQRHRGRQKRERWTKVRRQPGDKSKNAKMATVLVMCTLRRTGGGYLDGPVNKTVYGSFASKRHAVEVARREATKRGFPPGTRKIVQVLTDGDEALQLYIEELFPSAIHTVDIVHVIEKLWEAGHALFRKRSEREQWVEAQKNALYENRAGDIVVEIRRHHAAVGRSGPGTAERRKRLEEIANYIDKRKDRTNYGELMRRDLELSTGMVEGAIRALMCRRLDYGSMRWIKERAEAVLQLRCIDTNRDWDAFVAFVHDKMRAESKAHGKRIRLQQRQPQPLSSMARAA